jgi:UDP-3-O-[3-hydroxymyristoyl] N-acetylglucosamine deacetylase
VIAGQGLHGARPGSVTLARSRADAPTRLRRGADEAPLDAFVVVDSARSTTIETADGRLRIATVEHLFAALAAYGARRGLLVTIDGPEIPLADGGARAFADALAELGLAPSTPSLKVARQGTVEVGTSRYAFRPSSGVAVEVRVDFGDARLAPTARWEGDAADFRERLSPARTFGFEHEVSELARLGLASHVSRESVVVLGEGRILSAGRPFVADEPARHKLLDLMGDLFVHGGPPIGEVVALRPGHAATHEAVRRARDLGLLTTAL